MNLTYKWKRSKRHLQLESLENRRMLAAGDILGQITRAGIDFGADIDVYGNILAVGAPLDDTTGVDAGRVYLYELNGSGVPTFLRAIENPNPANKNFGRALDLNGSQLVVGAKEAVSVFDLLNPAFNENFTDPTNIPFVTDDFGIDVAIAGDHFVVVDSPEFGFSSVYEVHKFTLSTGESFVLSSGSEKVNSVSIDGMQAAIGFVSGVEVFDVTTGNVVDSFDIANQFQGTTNVSLQGNQVAVGASRYVDQSTFRTTGIAYLFEVGTDDPLETWTNPSPVTSGGFSVEELFGESAALDGRIVIVGEPQGESPDEGTADSPSVSLFDTVTGDRLITVAAPGSPLASTSSNYNFGRSVAVSGRFAIASGNATVLILDSGLPSLNEAPVLSNMAGTATFTEGGSNVLVAPQATVADADSLNFATGSLTVAITQNADASDRLSIRNAGTGPGKIGVSGTNVTFGGVIVGTFTGGTGATPLQVTFNSNATAAIVQVVARNIVFRNAAAQPKLAQRTVTFTVNDGDGGVSSPAHRLLKVLNVNDDPVLGSFGSNLTYRENAPALRVTSTATITDVDPLNFEGGQLTVRFSSGATGADILAIRTAGAVATSGNQVILNGRVIGTFNGGVGVPLVITFNAFSSPSKAQAILRNVTYRNSSDAPVQGTRSLEAFVTDGDGGSSVTVSKSVTDVAKNDPPVLGGIGGTIGYTHGTTAIRIASAATVTDPDSPDFAGGRLLIRFTQGAHISNRLGVSGGFSFNGTTVLYQGTQIGTRNADGGIGARDLIISFNASMTPALAQRLLRSLVFRTQGTALLGARTVALQMFDGDGGALPVAVTKTVNVAL